MSRLIKDSFFTTFTFFAERSFGFVRELILASLLGPTAMGLRNIILVLNGYSLYLPLGVNIEVYRKITKNLNRNTQDVIKDQKIVMSWSFFTSLLLTVIIVLYILSADLPIEFRIALIFLILMSIFLLFTNPLAYFLHAAGEFKKASMIESVKVFLDFILTVLLAYYFGFLGAVLGLSIALFIRYMLYRKAFSKYNISFEWDYIFKRWDDFIKTLKAGLRLFMTSIASTIYAQVDSLITVVMLGPAALGIYGIATTLNQLIYGTYGSTVIPVGQRMYKSADDEAKLKRYLDMLSGISSYLMVFPIIAIVLISPYIINYFIPAFSDAIPVIGVLAVASFFNVTLNPISNYLLTKRKENLITISTLVAATLNLILNIYLIQQGYGLTGVAYATSISYFVNFALLMYLSKALELGKVLEDLLPFIYLISVLWAWTTNYTIYLLPVFTIIYVPILLYVFYKRGILSYLLNVISELKAKLLLQKR
ncbi:MAG: polysaccharide biosynthesis C-terminal domain-containing protein [Candidatus Micrarchaeia archaeon]